ncbi:Mitochondrial import inner membrane translocase subunit TIM17-2 [Platanthera guangdongensis]|uniref:Mitochondrial import inner membrane translocase subunit TIM17-2 n=1 Tax=Platanthera guangdongensis TaxID=2320717 RepID=A0ABR2MZG6_9ASPA
MGAVGGSAFHFIKGIYNFPNGERLAGGMQNVRMNAPRVGGSFAVWGGLFSAFHCTMVYVRQKEVPWNSIIAGAATGGFLSMRQGIMLNRVLSAPQNLPPMDDPNLAAMMAAGGGSGPLPGFLPPGSAPETIPSALVVISAVMVMRPSFGREARR